MKIVKTFRIDEAFSKKLISLAESQGITFSQFVELACYALADETPKPTKLIKKSTKKVEVIDLQFTIDQPTYKKLAEITQIKNSTLSQEIYYRLSATLADPIFDTQEFNQLHALHFDLNRLGNLFKLAINNKMPVETSILEDIRKDIKSVSDELGNILSLSRKRKL